MYLDKNRQLPLVIRETVATTTWPIINFVDAPSQIAKGIGDKFVSKEQLRQQNLKLKETVRTLRRQVQKLSLLDSEIKKYKKLLSAAKDIKETVKVARIYNVNVDRDKRQIKLNMGRRDCVYLDQAVVDADGVMGQVIDVNILTSTVQLITDQNHIMPVQFKKSQLRTIAVGDGKDRLKLPNLATSTEVTIGEEIVTSGLGNVYPYGYSVGKVIEITTSPDAKYKTAYVKPTAQLNRAREALLVWTDDPLKPRKHPKQILGVKVKCP